MFPVFGWGKRKEIAVFIVNGQQKSESSCLEMQARSSWEVSFENFPQESTGINSGLNINSVSFHKQSMLSSAVRSQLKCTCSGI